MRHKKDVRKLGRNKSQRKSLMRNMAISFFRYRKIVTTEAKAKELKRTVERLITIGKKQDAASWRRIDTFLSHPATTRIVQEIGAKYIERKGGYTQIVRLVPRRGDGGARALIQLVG